MKKLFFVCIGLCLCITACKKGENTSMRFISENMNRETRMPENINVHHVIHGKVTDHKGNVLHYTFDNNTHEAVFVLNGEVIEMSIDTTEFSGTSYRSDRYWFSDFNGEIELRKDDEIIFGYKENTEIQTFHGKNGKSMQVSFNNADGSATVLYNEKEILLKQDSVASGIQYSNSLYEYREHQGKVELLKEGKMIFNYQK